MGHGGEVKRGPGTEHRVPCAGGGPRDRQVPTGCGGGGQEPGACAEVRARQGSPEPGGHMLHDATTHRFPSGHHLSLRNSAGKGRVGLPGAGTPAVTGVQGEVGAGLRHRT